MKLKIVLLLFCSVFISSGVGQTFSCPSVRTTSGWLDLFPLPCKKHAECNLMGNQYRCCKGFCTLGITTNSVPRTIEQTQSSKPTTSTTTTTTTSTTTTTTTTTTPSTTTSSTTTTQRPTTTKPKTTTSGIDLLQPYLQLLPVQRSAGSQINASTAKPNKKQKFVCPKGGQEPFILFPVPCDTNSQCRSSVGPDQVCCNKKCIKGIPAPRPTSAPRPHQPLLGVIPRECPAAPLGELLFDVQQCKTDAECWPRLCCQDGDRAYCRTAKARLDLVPIARQIDPPVRMFEQYLQCTPPPEQDLFPQKCQSSVDCFPNLCCAEKGKKHCRPAQRSILALLAGVTQRVGSTIGSQTRA